MSRTPVLQQNYGWVESIWKDDPEVVKGDGANYRVLERLDWSGAWRLVRTVVVKRCGLPDETDVREGILKRRGGKGWVHVITG